MRPMSDPARRRLVSLAAILFVLCCGFEIATGRDHWPFSPYPMFSHVEEPRSTVRYRAWGVLAADASGPAAGGASWPGPEAGVVELADPDWIAPFHEVRLSSALKHMGRGRDAAAAYGRAAEELLERYERRRRGGEHDGPALAGLRIVELRFTVSLAEPTREPVSVRTLAEARLVGGAIEKRDGVGGASDRVGRPAAEGGGA